MTVGLRRLLSWCRAWEWTNACYERLLERCQSDRLALRNIRHDIGRYVVYYEPCRRRESATTATAHRHSMDYISTPSFSEFHTKAVKSEV